MKHDYILERFSVTEVEPNGETKKVISWAAHTPKFEKGNSFPTKEAALAWVNSQPDVGNIEIKEEIFHID